MKVVIRHPYIFITNIFVWLTAGIIGLFYLWQEGHAQFVYAGIGFYWFTVLTGAFAAGIVLVIKAALLIYKERVCTHRVHEYLLIKDLDEKSIANFKGILARHIEFVLKRSDSRTKETAHLGRFPEVMRILENATVWTHFLSVALVSLGLLGTVVGLSAATSGFGTLKMGAQEAIAEMIPFMGRGIAVALISTGVGITLSLYLRLVCNFVDKEIADLRFAMSEILWQYVLKKEENGGVGHEEI